MRPWLTIFSLSPRFSSRFECIRRHPWLQGLLREVLAECLSTFAMMYVGFGANAQFTIGGGSKGDWLAMMIAWGLAITLAIYIAGGVSGAHCNPAVTLTMATQREFEWYKVLPYIAGQFAGAMAGTGLAYLVYLDAIHSFDPPGADGYLTDKSAQIFITLEAPYLTTRGAIVDNIAGTALVMIGLSAINDARNFNPVPGALAPLMIGLFITSVCLAFSMNTGAPFNVVRDFPQRVFCSFAGWGTGVFSRHDNYWPVPLVCPILGAQIGMLIYDLGVAVHHDAPNDGPSDPIDILNTIDDPSLGLHSDSRSEYGASSFPSGLLESASGTRYYGGGFGGGVGGGANIHAVGGRPSVALRGPSGMVSVNEGFLDPKIKESADAVFHRERAARRAAGILSPNAARSPQVGSPILQPFLPPHTIDSSIAPLPGSRAHAIDRDQLNLERQ